MDQAEEEAEGMIAAYGNKRIADMSRDDLINALDEMCERYMMLNRSRMLTNEVPVFHEDMNAWNDKLAEWFSGSTTSTNNLVKDT